jgi:hypothetical protein
LNCCPLSAQHPEYLEALFDVERFSFLELVDEDKFEIGKFSPVEN